MYDNDAALEKMLSILEKTSDNPLDVLFKDVATVVRQRVEEARTIDSHDGLKWYYGDEAEEDAVDEWKAISEGRKVKIGSFVDEDEDAESFLCGRDLCFEGKGFEFRHYGGY
jgi:hypothetical protein